MSGAGLPQGHGPWLPIQQEACGLTSQGAGEAGQGQLLVKQAAARTRCAATTEAEHRASAHPDTHPPRPPAFLQHHSTHYGHREGIPIGGSLGRPTRMLFKLLPHGASLGRDWVVHQHFHEHRVRATLKPQPRGAKCSVTLNVEEGRLLQRGKPPSSHDQSFRLQMGPETTHTGQQASKPPEPGPETLTSRGEAPRAHRAP